MFELIEAFNEEAILGAKSNNDDINNLPSQVTAGQRKAPTADSLVTESVLQQPLRTLMFHSASAPLLDEAIAAHSRTDLESAPQAWHRSAGLDTSLRPMLSVMRAWWGVLEKYGVEPNSDGEKQAMEELNQFVQDPNICKKFKKIDTLLNLAKDDPGHSLMGRGTFADLGANRGICMRYELQGPANAPKLLYISGETDDLRKSLTRDHFHAFTGNFRALTCDLRNQGLTTPLALDDYVPQQTYVEDLIALVDRIFGPQQTVHVVGWGFGAVLALTLARTYPDRIKKLVVIGAGYFEPRDKKPLYGPLNSRLFCNYEWIFGDDWRMIQDISAYTKLNLEDRCRRVLVHADIRRSSTTFRQEMQVSFATLLHTFVRSEMVSVMKDPAGLGHGVLAQECATYIEGTPNLDQIRTPTLIVHGMHDGMYSLDRATELKRRMPGAQMVVLQGEGHVAVTAAEPLASKFLLQEDTADMFNGIDGYKIKHYRLDSLSKLSGVMDRDVHIVDRVKPQPVQDVAPSTGTAPKSNTRKVSSDINDSGAETWTTSKQQHPVLTSVVTEADLCDGPVLSCFRHKSVL